LIIRRTARDQSTHGPRRRSDDEAKEAGDCAARILPIVEIVGIGRRVTLKQGREFQMSLDRRETALT